MEISTEGSSLYAEYAFMLLVAAVAEENINDCETPGDAALRITPSHEKLTQTKKTGCSQ